VTFQDNGVAITGGANVALVGGIASFVTTALGSGSHSITAAYSGASGFAPSTSSVVTQVADEPPAVNLGSTPNLSNPGQSVSFTATMTPNPGALGTVTFLDNGVAIAGGANVALVSGVASFATAALASGSHSITAVYSGASGFASSTSSVVTQ